MPVSNEGSLLVCLFHLNLAYSSLEEEERRAVVGSCYWPMLELAESFPLAIEASGWTLEEIARLDESWIRRCRELIAAGSVELVGSAWAQCAGPLLPAEVNAWNLRLGLEAYERLLGARPSLALVAEQAYSPGLVPLFLEAGYEAIVADWDNAFRSHGEWPGTHRRFPQRALGSDGRSIPVAWSQSIVFQKFQRFAHGELPLDEYLDFVRTSSGGDGVLFIYANDAEIFDRRPGRFAAEPPLQPGEWERIASALTALREDRVGTPSLPSATLTLLDRPEAGQEVALEAADQPVPVKKQDKYNVGRWAVTGRDDIGVNTRCWRIYDHLRRRGSEDPSAWRELCELWASDFRTHITDRRWEAYLARLRAVERGIAPAAPEPGPARRPRTSWEANGSLVTAQADGLSLTLNARRGLTIASFADRAVAEEPLVGTIPHGYFETIELGADWYSGSLVHERPLRHKVTDLVAVEPLIDAEIGVVTARFETELGQIEKTVSLHPDERAVEIAYALHWRELPVGSLRLGFVTLLPEAFDRESLWFAAHNGGRELERHRVGDAPFDHGDAVSALVSSRQGLGATGGVVELGDAERRVVIEIDQEACYPIALVSFRPARRGFLFRVSFTLAESDDTRRGGIPRAEPQRFRMRVHAGR